MDLNEQLRQAKVEAEKQAEEAKRRHEQRSRTEAAHRAWQFAARLIEQCYEAPDESIAVAIDAIQSALNASDEAGELSAVRAIATFYLAHQDVFTLEWRVAATIVNAADHEGATELLKNAVAARKLMAVAQGIEAIGEVAWQGHTPEVYYRPSLRASAMQSGTAELVVTESSMVHGASPPALEDTVTAKHEDGPLADRVAFNYQGREYTAGLEPITWRFLRATFWRIGEFINGRDLVGSVWERTVNEDAWKRNPDAVLTETQAKDLIAKVNGFARLHSLPFHAEQNAKTGARVFALFNTPPKPARAARPRSTRPTKRPPKAT